MARRKKSLKAPQKDGVILVNKLTVTDARRLLLHEGGEATRVEYAMQLGMILVTAWFSARAIWVEGATAWYLLLPLLAQYVALLVTLPLLQGFYRLSGLQGEIRKCWWNLALWTSVAVVVVLVRSRTAQVPWPVQFRNDANLLWESIHGRGMAWAMASAALGMALSLPARMRAFRDFGPPFVSISFGCAAKLVALLLGSFLLPMVLSDAARTAWFLWTALLVGETGALVGLWDIRRRLRRLDAGTDQANGAKSLPLP